MSTAADLDLDNMLVPLSQVAYDLDCDEAVLVGVIDELAPYIRRQRGQEIHFRWGDLGPVYAIAKQAKRVAARRKQAKAPEVYTEYPYIHIDALAQMLDVPSKDVRIMLKQRLNGRREISRTDLWATISDGMALYRAERRLPVIKRKDIPHAIKLAVIQRDQDLCRYCACKLTRWKKVFDHVVPVSQDGPNTFENLVQACRACNHRKYNKTPEQAGMPLLPPGTMRKSRQAIA